MAGIENNIVFGGGFKLMPSSSRDISDMQRTNVDVSRINYIGNPEGIISANPSSLSHDPISGVIYIKSSGTGNTGWSLLSSYAFSPVAFSAYLTSTQSNVTGDGTHFTPAYDGILSNIGGAYDGSTGVFTAPETGVYSFGYISCYNNVGSSTAIINAFASGSPENYSFRADQTTAVSAISGTLITNGLTVVSLLSGTTLQLTCAAFGTTKTVGIEGGELGSYAVTSMFFGNRIA